MCVQMHGDAAFTGQGVVMEGLGLSEQFYVISSEYSQYIIYLQAIFHTILVEGVCMWS